MQKATREQVRRHNRELVLRAVYNGQATNRAALAQETGLTKPAISDLVQELIDEDLLIEGGYGESGSSGGKRPRILQFVPEARQVIGISIREEEIRGVLTNLDGTIVAQHYIPLSSPDPDEVLERLTQTINGLIAQITTRLLCIGIGIQAIVSDGIIQYAPRFQLNNFPLRDLLTQDYEVPIIVANSTELAAIAQFAFGEVDNGLGFATVLAGDSIGVGLVSLNHQTGNDIGHLKLGANHIEELLGWASVKRQARQLGDEHHSPYLCEKKLSYLLFKLAAAHADPAAQQLQDFLADGLAQVFAWTIALMRPRHISLAGPMAEMGDAYLNLVVEKLKTLVLPELLKDMTFTVEHTPNLVAIGAAAKSIQSELGLVYSA